MTMSSVRNPAAAGKFRRTLGAVGTVVEMNAPARRKRRASRTALVLGGGGFTGGVYQIGALRALDLLSSNRSVNQFDIYVGTSAGALIASLVANGVTPEQMMRTVNEQTPYALPPLDREMFLRLNKSEFALRALKLPLQAVSVARNVASSLTSLSAVDLVLALGDALPSGVYTGEGVEAYLREALTAEGRTDDFRRLANELYLAATDLDTCERIVLGAEGWDDIPISSAVRASTALPMVYAPYRVRERELVDGGIVSTTNLDIAVEAGARFIVVVNPLVPYVNDFSKSIPTLFGTRARRVSDMGLPKIGYQTFKLLAYQRLHEMASHWKARYPGVDIVLIEPDPDDELMFQTNILNFASRVDVARHGFESVTLKLAQDYEDIREVCRRHGIEISATRVRKVVKHFSAEREKTRAWRRILEQTTGALLRQSATDQAS
jgi:predicted acylesterase/phospholipase RssA